VIATATTRTIIGNGNVTDLASTARVPAEYDAINNDPGPDAGANCHDEKIVVLTSDAVQALGYGERVHIVLDQHWQCELSSESCADRNLLPTELSRIDQSIALSVDGPRYPDPNAQKWLVGPSEDESAEKRREVGKHRVRRCEKWLARGTPNSTVNTDFNKCDVVSDDLDADRSATR